MGPEALRWSRLVAGAVAAVLLLAGCGAGPQEADRSGSTALDAAPGPAPAGADAASPPAARVSGGRNDLPAVAVVDVADGSAVDLRSLAPAERPLLVWFWAPH